MVLHGVSCPADVGFMRLVRLTRGTRFWENNLVVASTAFQDCVICGAVVDGRVEGRAEDEWDGGSKEEIECGDHVCCCKWEWEENCKSLRAV